MVNKDNFTKNDSSWELKHSPNLFLGKHVDIYIDTKTDSEHPDREIFDEQIETVNIISSKWQELAKIIEKEILAYENIPREDLLEVMDTPCIWLGMDYNTNEPLKENHWSFVLGVTESEDFGWHVEFNGIIHQETWAGG